MNKELHRHILATIGPKQPPRLEYDLRRLYGIAERIRLGHADAASGTTLLVVSNEQGVRVTDSVSGVYVYITADGRLESGQLWATEINNALTGQNSVRIF